MCVKKESKRWVTHMLEDVNSQSFMMTASCLKKVSGRQMVLTV